MEEKVLYYVRKRVQQIRSQNAKLQDYQYSTIYPVK